jgi:hypothetical protein
MDSHQVGWVILDGEAIQPYRLLDADGVVIVEYLHGQYMAQTIPIPGTDSPKVGI